MATQVETPQLPHLKVVNRVLELPIVELAVVKSAETYSRVKGSNQLVYWAFTTAETSLSTATERAMPIAVPIAKRLESPINFVDNTLCLGLDKIEEKLPLVKEKPAQILEKAASSISHVNELIVTQATNLRDLSWNTANHILDTHYGSVAVKGLDNTAVVVDKLIDRYFPATEEEKPIVLTDEGDKLLHTLQTVGHLSNKAARRVYSNIIQHLNTVKKDGLLKVYVNNLVEFLRLTKYLHTVSEKTPHMNGETKEEPQDDKEKSE